MSFYEIALPPSRGPSSSGDILRLLQAMRPQPSAAPLVRIGPGGDGTYLLPDDLKGITACFSPGVDNFKNFEDVLANRYGIAAHMCDGLGSADELRTPLIPGKQTFEKLWLDINGAEGTVSLDDWVSRHSPDPAEDLILQMDIEGAEYRNLLGCSDEVLKRFRIIVLEVHTLMEMKNDTVLAEVLLPFFERLNQHFTCVHLHPNNVLAPFDIDELGITVPHILELTYLRNDRFEGKDLHKVELPNPADIEYNVPNQPPAFMDDFFRGRPPSASENLRMLNDKFDWHYRETGEMIGEGFENVSQRLARLDVVTAERDAAFVENHALKKKLGRTFRNRLRKLIGKKPRY